MNRITKAAVMDKRKALNSGIDKIKPNQVERVSSLRINAIEAYLGHYQRSMMKLFAK